MAYRYLLGILSSISLLTACGGSSGDSSPPNHSPVAAADSVRTWTDVATTAAVLANDSDADGDSFVPVLISQPLDGAASINSNGTITFVPAKGFAGTASITYKIVDSKGAESAPVVLQVDVRPRPKVVYLTAAGPEQRLVYDDAKQANVIWQSDGTNTLSDLQVSKNRRTLQFNVGANSVSSTYGVDLTGSLELFSISAQGPLSNLGNYSLQTVSGLAGYFYSSSLYLVRLYDGGSQQINPGSLNDEQVTTGAFSSDDQFIFYISHAPAAAHHNAKLMMASIASLGSSIQLTPNLVDNDVIDAGLQITGDNKYVVYRSNRASGTDGIYGINISSPGIETVLGPTTPYLIASNTVTISGYAIGPQGHYGAYTASNYVTGYSVPANAYLFDLDNMGAYMPIGTTFAAGTRLGTPVFSPDGQRILLRVISPNNVALYETTVGHPEMLTQMTPSYSVTSTIAAFQYTPNSKSIVLSVDAQQSGAYDLYKIDVDSPQQAVRLNLSYGASTAVLNSYFSISPDGTTVAYGQPEQTGGSLSLFLVDLATPGVPLKLGSNVDANSLSQEPFVFVP